MEDPNQVEGESDAKKSISTSFTYDSGIAAPDLRIDQVNKNHYVYRKGTTKVHVQTYDVSSKSDVIDEGGTVNIFLKGISLFSALLALTLMMITLVIKLTAAITEKIVNMQEDEYMLTLYAAGFVWTAYYNFQGIFKRRNRIKFSKTNQSSNLWLKGVIVLFGVAIVLKNVLEFITFVSTHVSNCPYNQVEASHVFMHILFIVSQVKYLFTYSKVYIRNCSKGSRIGLMFIIAINLSTWIASIVDETLLALDHANTTTEDVVDHYVAADTDKGGSDCQCHSTFCQTVHVAETFLFPFVIEFSLVASCLLYVTWSNIGKQPPPCERVVKPSYKFYRKYTGAVLGGLALFVMIIFLIVLGTTGSGVEKDEKTYFTESDQLLYYDGFLMGLELVMMLVTLAGFYLFHKIRRPLEKASMLDQVLLVVCILGPIAISIFSMVAVIIGPDNKSVAWVLTLLRPLVDVLQCVLQLMFILFGLKREPVASASSKETAAQLQSGLKREIKLNVPDMETSSEDDEGNSNMAYLRSRRSSITSVVSRLANSQLYAPNTPGFENDGVSVNQTNGNTVEGNGTIPSLDPPAIIVSKPEEESIEKKEDDQEMESVNETPPHFNHEPSPHSILKIVSETKVARPDMLRSWLRDVIFFLLMTNASLWLFQSLSGTAFTVYQYETIFFGTSAWTTIVMICRPLNIFFRMHSAGCLFEMWTFA